MRSTRGEARHRWTKGTTRACPTIALPGNVLSQIRPAGKFRSTERLHRLIERFRATGAPVADPVTRTPLPPTRAPHIRTMGIPAVPTPRKPVPSATTAEDAAPIPAAIAVPPPTATPIGSPLRTSWTRCPAGTVRLPPNRRSQRRRRCHPRIPVSRRPARCLHRLHRLHRRLHRRPWDGRYPRLSRLCPRR